MKTPLLENYGLLYTSFYTLLNLQSIFPNACRHQVIDYYTRTLFLWPFGVPIIKITDCQLALSKHGNLFTKQHGVTIHYNAIFIFTAVRTRITIISFNLLRLTGHSGVVTRPRTCNRETPGFESLQGYRLYGTRSPYVHCMPWRVQYDRWNFLRIRVGFIVSDSVLTVLFIWFWGKKPAPVQSIN